MRIWQGIALLLALALSACMTPQAQDSSAVDGADAVYVIRHLQKAAGDDPVLTSEGAANAQILAAMLENKGITAIYSTDTRRTMQTAEPLAERIGLTINAYDHRQPEALAALVAANEGAVLVVGHSNTVGDLITHFGGTTAPVLTEQDYGTLFM
ncbi:MAG: SixA phosphatase family protein, partial [Marivita sp.]|uniref:SixA phosphatase family protein n=1 Tax=Marivita sp. TaxID=2003365 RepID=UPI003EF21509